MSTSGNPSTDETFLESFIESISTLPHELRRDLELLKDLDCSYVLQLEQLREAEEAYAASVEECMLKDVLPKLVSNNCRKRKREEVVAKKVVEEKEEKEEKGDGIKEVAQEKQSEKNVEESQKDDCKNDDDNTKNTNSNNNKNNNSNDNDETVSLNLPTTEELQDYIHLHSSSSSSTEYNKILNYKAKCFKLAQEKIAVSNQAYSIVDAAVRRLDLDLQKFEGLLKSTGEFAATGGAKPNDLAAIQVNPNSTDWILAKVISHDPKTAMYKLSDEDVESNKIFNLPESQVVVLGGVDRLSRGDIIYAVYPDTTSFYQATVAQAPRKVSGGGSFVMVNFKDDGDENGVTHEKAVLMKHVMRVPYVLT